MVPSNFRAGGVDDQRGSKTVIFFPCNPHFNANDL